VNALGVTDVDFMAAIVLPSVAHVVSACCVGCPCLVNSWGDLCLNFASQWCKGVSIVVVLAPEVCMLIPKWKQTLFWSRESPKGNFLACLPVSI
jgi:hypothetical protein